MRPRTIGALATPFAVLILAATAAAAPKPAPPAGKKVAMCHHTQGKDGTSPAGRCARAMPDASRSDRTVAADDDGRPGPAPSSGSGNGNGNGHADPGTGNGDVNAHANPSANGHAKP